MKLVKNISSLTKRLFNTFDSTCTRSYWVVLLQSLLSAVLEIVGITVLLHTMLSILKPDFIEHNYFTSWLYNTLKIKDMNSFIMLMSVLLLLMYIAKNILIVYINKLQVHRAYDITDRISERYFNKVANKELLYFKSKKSSEVMNGLITTSLNFPDCLLMPSVVLLSEIAVVALILGSILFYNPTLFFFTAITVIPTSLFLIYMNRKKLKKSGEYINELNPEIIETVVELTNGIANIKLWNGSHYFFDRYTYLKKEIYKQKERIYINSNFVPIRIYEAIAISGIFCVILFGLIRYQDIGIVISFISIYAGVSFRLLPSINRIIGSTNSMSTYEYILDYIEEDDKQFANEKNNVHQLDFKERIELKDIYFEYSENKPILDGLNLAVQKGEFIGIMGASGEGKSTLVNVISSLIRPQKGEILLDNVVLSEEQFASYRYLFSYVRQDVFMLNDTILRNVAFLDSNPNLARANACLDKVNLSAWIYSLDDKLETKIGELGNQISGGQKQRIAIARALYKNAEIFIFDEVTNNLDSYSCKLTLETISQLKEEGKTAIFITHKKEELSICDTVYSLENKQLHVKE